MKTLVLDQIEVTKTGTIQLRMHRLSSDGDLLGNHRTSIEPGGDIDAQIAAVNTHMGGEGFAPIPAADVARVKAIAVATWTPELITAVTAQVNTMISAQAAARLALEAETAAHETAKADSEIAKNLADVAKGEAQAAANDSRQRSL